jgi:hypothetical protein
LTGPTYFEPMIRRFSDIVKEETKIYSHLYFIFVILTDGCIHDMKLTTKLMVDLSYQPISVIIVGIGDNDFEEMDKLDADKVVLTDSDGRVAARDIC